jgi:D-alanyl-D-alanine carboxypeptidase (penicillin-binding protein 5/6)
MRKKFKVESSKLRVNTWCYPLVLLLFTIHFSLSASYADDINSRAAVVMDASTGAILYAKNPDLRCPPASTTKLMTAIVAIERADMHDIVTISRNASRTPPHKAGFREGDKVTVEELMNAALISSANDAAVALAEEVAGSEGRFVELMNRKAAAIGARDTRFINANGLPGADQYTTATDLSKIMAYALRYQKLREIIGTRVSEISTERGKAIFLRNTNKLLWSEDDLVGGKTGYTRKARHCFVCAAERKQDTVIVTILGSPSREGLWKESASLITRGFYAIENAEEPVIYLAKTDSTQWEERTKVHGKKKKITSKSKSKAKKYLAKKSKKHKKCLAKKSGAKKKVLTAKKKGKKPLHAKRAAGKKNCSVAKKGALERNKG